MLLSRCEPLAGTRFLELLLNALGGDGLHQGRRVFGIEHLGLKLAQVSVHPKRRRLANGQMQVGGAALDAGFQESVDLNC